MRYGFRLLCLAILGSVLILCLSGCDSGEVGDPSCLGDLAYSSKKSEAQYTVYICENEAMVPYMVLTDNYGGTGKCLLLRKNVLDEMSVFNPNMRYSGYYEDSLIDQLLNGSFLNTIDKRLADLIPSVEIPITSKESLWGGGEDLTKIQRKVFLLSAAELGDGGSKTVLAEGNALKYFDSPQRRIACFADGTAVSWWLRSPDTWYDNVVCGVDTAGTIGIGGVGSFGEEGEYKSGVRPAFCLEPETPVYSKDNVFYLFETN